MTNPVELKLDQVAFATVTAGQPWTQERAANPRSWRIESSFSPVAERPSDDKDFDFGQLSTAEQRRVLRGWLPLSNLLLQRLTTGDNELVDLVATAVWSDGSRRVLVWPSELSPESTGPRAFVSPPAGDGAAEWYESADAGEVSRLGWSLWDRVHPIDPDLRETARELFQAQVPRDVSFAEIAPDVTVQSGDRPSPSIATEDQTGDDQALDWARSWHQPLTEPSRKELSLGGLEARRAMGGDLGYYGMVLPGMATSVVSAGYVFATAKEWLPAVGQWAFNGALPPGADLTPTALGVGGTVAGLVVAAISEAPQRVKDRFRRGQNRRYLLWARDNLPTAEYYGEAGLLAEGKSPSRPAGSRRSAFSPGKSDEGRRRPRLRRRRPGGSD